MSSRWHRLCLPQSERIPPLLYKYVPSSRGYDIHITDLTNVWSERLGLKDILRRAEDTNTTIDPNADPDQFDVLLEKIGEALQHRPGSSIALSQGSSTGSLELCTSTKLPSPLRPLQWTLYLSKETPASVTSLLLLPLLKQEANWEARQRALLNQLKQKDWVLGKLFDKIEALGVDLSSVFPSIAGLRSTGRKNNSLSHAAKYIKGIAPFDEAAWIDEAKAPNMDIRLAANLFTELSSSDSTLDVESIATALNNWWESLGTHRVPEAPVEEDSDRPAEKSTKHIDAETASELGVDEDEFERQEKPPRLKQPHEDGEELITSAKQAVKEAARRPPSPKPTRPKKAPNGLGTIGGKKAAKEPSPAPPSSTASEDSISAERSAPVPSPTPGKALDAETDSPSDLDAKSSPLTAVQPSTDTPLKKKSRGLGVIGGKKKKKEEEQPPLTSSELHSEPNKDIAAAELGSVPSPSGTKAKKPQKLGVIGGKAKGAHRDNAGQAASVQPKEEEVSAPSAPSASAPNVQLPQPKAPAPEPEVKKEEETEQQKVERRREELKRRLEVKSAAQTKKKRRF